MPVTIFIGLSEEEQAEIFYTINSEQVKVNPSVKIELKARDVAKTPEAIAICFSRLFAITLNSPWHKIISFGAVKDNLFSPKKIIALASFAQPIVNLIYDDNNYFELKQEFYNFLATSNENKIEKVKGTTKFRKFKPSDSVKQFIWNLYINDQEEYIYKILDNYFNAIKDSLIQSWGNKI